MAINEAFGWCWILAGLVVGLVLGLRFHQDDWLGGYGSFPRRLIRLGHVAFIGLGMLNILFALSVPRLGMCAVSYRIAAAALIVGAVTMPLCCGLMAWRKAFQPLFAIPVLSLIGALVLIVAAVLRP